MGVHRSRATPPECKAEQEVEVSGLTDENTRLSVEMSELHVRMDEENRKYKSWWREL